MIPVPLRCRIEAPSIPRESGDDPVADEVYISRYLYSPRERG